MPESGQTRAAVNREIRRKALREQLANGKHLEHVVEISNKIKDLDNELEASDISRLKIAAELKLALIKKYLPDIKQTELTGEEGGPIELTDLTESQLDKRIRELSNELGS